MVQYALGSIPIMAGSAGDPVKPAIVFIAEQQDSTIRGNRNIAYPANPAFQHGFLGNRFTIIKPDHLKRPEFERWHEDMPLPFREDIAFIKGHARWRDGWHPDPDRIGNPGRGFESIPHGCA